MRRLALILALSGCVTWEPPARFQGGYAGDLAVTRLPQAEIPAACAEMMAGLDFIASMTQRGCARVWPGRCRIIIVDRSYRGATPAAVLRHEIGHCNGWPGDHPL